MIYERYGLKEIFLDQQSQIYIGFICFFINITVKPSLNVSIFFKFRHTNPNLLKLV